MFSYKIRSEDEKIAEILYAMFLRNKADPNAELQEGETIHVFSMNGKEAIVVRCGPAKVHYGIYDTNPKSTLKSIYLSRSSMTEVKGLTNCQRADYDAANAKLIIHIDAEKAIQFPIARNLTAVSETLQISKVV
ncbi:unnamed protein product [Gongylonema pulchrum]|uniref:Uncharacterized protein n=1 Tax=Gongylonema pulchrum TaxID=637853 RepID=A0A3P6QW93_9BILA|nr:unnamed protein product [Gongylonema pulchrum]